MLKNDKVSFAEVARYDIPMDEIENKLRSLRKWKNRMRQSRKKEMEQIMMKMQLYMKKKEEDKTIKSDCNVLKVMLSKLVITRFNGTHID